MAIVISGVNNNDKITASDGTIDLLSGVSYAGIITAPAFTTPGNLTAGSINVGSGIQLGNAGVATATTFVGNLTGNVNATSNLLLQIGGSEKFRVGSSGQLGIGGANYGTSGQVLTSGGSGSAATWSTITGTTINNNANNRLITGSGTANTLEGESNLIFTGTRLGLNNTSPTPLNGDGTGMISVAGGNPEVVLVRTTSGTEAKASIRVTDGEDFKIAVKDGSGSTIDAFAIDTGTGNATFNSGATGDAQLTVHAEQNDSGADSELILETSNDFATSVIMFKDSTAEAGSVAYNHGDNYIKFSTNGTNGGTERVRIDAGGNMNVTGIVTATAFVSTEQGSASFRNLVHNGNMYINQRGVTSSTSTGHITCDRWRTWHHSHGATCTTSISDVASGTNPYQEGHRKAYKLAMSGSASAAAPSSVFMAHTVEAQNVAQCGWDYKSTTSFITVQFWVKASHTQSYTATIMTPDSTGHRNYGWSFALSANTWTKVIKTIPGDSNLLFNNDNGSGLAFYIFAWIGDNYDNITSADSWIVYDGDEYSLPISSGWLLSSSPTFEVTGVQIEVGKVATSYEHRSLGTELQLCQRYYQKDITRRAYWGSGNVSDRQFPVHFITEMRDTPTVSFHSTSLDGGSAAAYNKTRQGYNFAMTGNGRFYEWAHEAKAEI